MRILSSSLCSGSGSWARIITTLTWTKMWPPGHTPQRYDEIPEGLFYEETSIEVLDSIATDWTLAIEKLAANCSNISDEVYPGVHLGNKYERATNIQSFPSHHSGFSDLF